MAWLWLVGATYVNQGRFATRRNLRYLPKRREGQSRLRRSAPSHRVGVRTMTSVVCLVLMWVLPVLCGLVRPPLAQQRHVRRPAAASLPRYSMMGAMVAEEEGMAGTEGDGEINAEAGSGEDEIDEAAIDALVRREVEAAFAGLEEALNSGDEKAALALIQSQGKEVLGNVLSQLEDDGQLLSSTIATRIEELTTTSKADVMRRYDNECARSPLTAC